MSDYISEHLPEIAETLRTTWEAVLTATGGVGRAEAAKARAETEWVAANALAIAAVRAHFAATTPPPGVAVPATLADAVALAVSIPSLEWDSAARRFREQVGRGAQVTVATRGKALVLRTYVVTATRTTKPAWAECGALEIWLHSGTIAGSGGRKRVVSEDDCAALLALAKGEVTTC